MRGRSPSIRQTLMLITGALTLMITLLAAENIYGNWIRLTKIRTLEDATVLSDRLFDATERLSVERDVALSMLHAPDSDTVDNLRPRLLESRKDTVQTLRASIADLKRFEFPELSALGEKLGAHLSVIETLRPKVDEAAGQPVELPRRG